MHGSTELLDDAFGDVQAYPDAIFVNRAGSPNFHPLLEGLGPLVRGEPFAGVDHVHFELVACVVVRGDNLDQAVHGELQSILREVDQHLLQPYLIADEQAGEFLFAHAIVNTGYGRQEKHVVLRCWR